MPERPKISTLTVYATGQFGWSLASFAVFNLLAYFYLPPDEPGRGGFPEFIYPGAVLGVFTVVGLAGFVGRFADGIFDALIANWSDRRPPGTWKRRLPMAVAALPAAALAVLVFSPIKGAGPAATGWWLFAVLMVFYFFFSLYTVPFTALMAELGHDPRDRVHIATWLSVAWAAGFLLASNVYFFQSFLEEKGLAPVAAFQWVVAVFGGLACAAMLVPAFFLDEKRFARQSASPAPGLRESLRTVAANRNFRWFVATDLTYWLALTLVQTGVAYFTTLLFGFEKTRATAFLAVAGGVSLALYPAVNWLAARFGKKRVVVSAFWSFSALFGLVSLAGLGPLTGGAFFFGLAVAAGFPLSALGILPAAIVSDIIFEEEKRSGRQLAGMFFAARAFVMKVGVSLANLLFPSLLLLGKSPEGPFGVRASAVLAAVFCAAGLLFFRKYREDG